ncbi:DUF418 domain-containing protein [Gordonia soli]|uniref:DUF418 domain-containing protein n=1 Tax=Gordonia soli NBRC 108243 TaxID=1223545 RepID=M0QGF1_9ACTN|nr:DUF418 domain-containing protein [Gordonia soli]GAC67529.1 hypothetical protein GS4_08_01140 [Gordonia soli NBRC 108243]
MPSPTVTPGPRLVALDVLRGIAILGTLGTNIWIFTDASGLVGYIQGTGHASGAWGTVEAWLQQITQGKFLGLLTIMFGIGLAIQERSARRRCEKWPGTYPWRSVLLMVDGVVNYLLFAEFDVLMGYAVTGLIVAYLLTWRVRNQVRAAIIAVAIHVVGLTLLVWALATMPSGDPPEPLSPNPYADGSFVDLVVFRAQHMPAFRAEVIAILPMSIALFLLGAILFRHGIFGPEGTRTRRWLMVVGFGIALPLDFAVGLLGGSAGLVAARYGLAPVVSLGLLAAVAEWYARRPVDRAPDEPPHEPGRLARAIIPVGRTALSCYVLQNVLAGALCYGWGLGLAARLTPSTVVPATVGLFLVIAATLMIASRWWLGRFERGPLEWLWHSGYRRLSRIGSGPAGTEEESVRRPVAR